MCIADVSVVAMFQSPRGDFGFLKPDHHQAVGHTLPPCVSIPSRGFWFFEVEVAMMVGYRNGEFQSPRGDFGFLKDMLNRLLRQRRLGFNPLAGILVF